MQRVYDQEVIKEEVEVVEEQKDLSFNVVEVNNFIKQKNQAAKKIIFTLNRQCLYQNIKVQSPWDFLFYNQCKKLMNLLRMWRALNSLG